MSQAWCDRFDTVVRLLGIIILLGFFVAVFAAISANAQDASTGALRGTVFDTAGARIHGATVALVGVGNGVRYSATTNSQGDYVFEFLPPGDYSARAEFVRMSPQLSPALHIDVGGTSTLDFQLAIAGAKESITVSGAPQLIETQPSAISALIEEKAIEGLPLKEFFLVLSTVGKAYRRCQLAWVNGDQLGVRFIKAADIKKKSQQTVP